MTFTAKEIIGQIYFPHNGDNPQINKIAIFHFIWILNESSKMASDGYIYLHIKKTYDNVIVSISPEQIISYVLFNRYIRSWKIPDWL